MIEQDSKTALEIYRAMALAAKTRQDAYIESAEIARQASDNRTYSDDTRRRAFIQRGLALMLAKAAKNEATAMLAEIERLNTTNGGEDG